jgi:hypothetical protein
MLVDLIPVVGAIAPFFGLSIGLYMLVAMKRMYKQPWGKTIAKYGAFVLLFSIAIMIGLVGNLLITLAFI